jgi:Collagen triple helix repeat (20 copies)
MDFIAQKKGRGTRSMFSRIRKRATFANVAMTVALVFAMSGGAFAAGKYLITSTKQISPKVLKALKGANGSNGANGATGATGPAGPAGATGPTGATGPQGPQGEAGKGGAPGKDGKNGTTGFTEKLPVGKTETGAWAFGPFKQESLGGGGVQVLVPVASFAIPLATALGAGHVHYINTNDKEVFFEEELKERTSTDCLGTAAEPSAVGGNLCIYGAKETGAEGYNQAIKNPGLSFSEEAAGPSGAAVLFGVTESLIDLQGTWAVTG